jgi:phosphoglycerate dehydrogenase-like enzyme
MTTAALIIGRDCDVFVERLGREFPALAFKGAHDKAEALANCAASEILLVRNDEIFPELVTAMPRLKLIQALTTGTDDIAALPNLGKDVLLAAARGFHGPQMSELAFLFMLAFARNFPAVLENQKRRRWDRREQRLLDGRTVVIVGVGRIAEELAKRCKMFGMTVLGVTSRPSASGFDELCPRNRITDAAARADFLIVLAPLVPENVNLIDSRVLAAMKPDGVLINIARGGVVDEDALQRALAERRIAGAGLDVFRKEPLPPESPLWTMPNVIITSHVGGMSENYADQVMPLLIDNLKAYLAGRPEQMRYIVRL